MGVCEDHGTNCSAIRMKAEYRDQSKIATVHLLDHAYFQRLIRQFFSSRYPAIRLRLTRGFTRGGEIYLKENIIFGRKKLIQHEFGHLFGLTHTLKPHIMNASWILRWFSIPLITVTEVEE